MATLQGTGHVRRAWGWTSVARSVLLGWAIASLQCGGGGGALLAPEGGPGESSTDASRDRGHKDSSAEASGHDGGGDSSKEASGHDGGGDSSAMDASDATADVGHAVATLKGAIQKGPFILGSSVQISAIDGAGSSTGTTFETSTTDDLGHFTVSFAYRGYVDMQASGFYYDEVTGALSAAPIVLHALYDVASGGTQDAYINIVTHLAHDRAVSLMGADAGMSLEAAETQAESELIAALGIGGTGFNPGGAGVSLNELGTNDDSNAYLFAVSAILVETVIQKHGTSSLDANLQELIDTIASDLAAHGTLPSSVASEVLAAEEALDVDLTMDLSSYRLQAIGSSATPANLDRAVDSDGDGYRNTVDTCPLVANADQAVIPSGVLCSVTRHTRFLSAAPAASVTPIVADFENTGHAGALVQGATGWSLSLGDGTGRFGAPVAVTLPASFAPTLAYDINKDGNLDLVGIAGWVAGDGAGHFGALSSFGTTDAGAVLVAAFAVGDFNGDGLPDVAGFTSPTTTELAVLLATTPGVFGSPIISTVPFRTLALFPYDVNDDGNIDLVAVDYNSVALLGDGKGDFQPATPLPALVAAGGGAAVADFDGDGNVDVAVWGNGVVPSVQVAFGDGNGNFGSVATTSLSSSAIAVGDYNSDGQSDLWVGYPSAPCTANVSALLSKGRTFWPPQSLLATPGECGLGTSGIVSHDLNGDGIPDVVVLNQDIDGTWSLQGYILGAMPDSVCAGTMCHGVCVDTTTNFFNCSKCGDACELGATCTGSKCDCNGMEAVCGDACVDKSSNNDNCGTCGHGCGDLSTCQSGSCPCTGSNIVCSGLCVDPTTDSKNCNGCGNQCPSGTSCVDSSCVCPGTQIACGDKCVDTSSDNDNCGGCGLVCSAAPPSTTTGCSGGQCFVSLASADMNAIAVDGISVYWVTGGTLGTVNKVPVGGGPVATLVSQAAPLNEPFYIAVDETSVYWADTSNTGQGAIMKAPLDGVPDGGAPTTLATGIEPSSLAIDPSRAYLTGYYNDGGVVQAVPLGGVPDGGAPATLALGQDNPGDITVGGGNLYWLELSTTTSATYAIMREPADGGQVAQFLSFPISNGSPRLALDTTSLYWTDGQSVLKTPLDGGSTSTLAAWNGLSIAGLVSDGTSVYWYSCGNICNTGSGVIMKVPVTGGTVTTLATDQTDPFCLAVDTTSVYWCNNPTVNDPDAGPPVLMRLIPK